jgi:hypothetical protein
MGTRSSLLYDIEEALKERGLSRRIDSVPTLRGLFPGYRGTFTLDGLEQFLEAVSTADLDAWRNPAIKKPGPRRTRSQQRRIDKVLKLRSDGGDVRAIAHKLGVSKARIYQILKESKQ